MYDLLLSQYFAYTGKELVIKDINGAGLLSYEVLLWYINKQDNTNLDSNLSIDVNEKTKNFSRCFIYLEACCHGCQFCCPLIFLNGNVLKGKFNRYLIVVTVKKGMEVKKLNSGTYFCWGNFDICDCLGTYQY